MDAVADGLIERDLIDELVLLVAVWVDPDADDKAAVRAANRDATRRARCRRAASATATARIDELIALARQRHQRLLRRRLTACASPRSRRAATDTRSIRP